MPQEQLANSNNLGVERFRILIMGNANAGKTTILKKVCHARRREPVHPNINSEFHPSISRGEHDIEHQCQCPAAHSLVFHDSRGFEAGSAEELKKVRDFIESRAKREQLKDQLHVIWHCLPTSNDRGMTKAEMSQFESGTGNVPVIAIFTKMDALDEEARNQLMWEDVPLAKIKKQVPIRAEAIFRRKYLERLEGVKHRPRYVVRLRDMDKEGTKCEELILRTSQALNVDLTSDRGKNVPLASSLKRLLDFHPFLSLLPRARTSRDHSDTEIPSSNDNRAPNIVQNNDAPVLDSRLPSKVVYNNDTPVPDSRLPSKVVYNNDTPVPDSRLPSTVEAVAADFPRIRILVLGKTGCGKSSLINKIFGVDLAEISHDSPGKVDINTGLFHSSNNRFIFHDSEGFEPGEDAKLNKVKRFIEERTQSKMLPKDKLHVIWICISVPTANDRVIEPGVEEVFKMAQERGLPAIIIFTKYDKLVTTATASGPVDQMDREQMWQYGENKAKEDFEELCIRPWRAAVGKVPLMVSTKPRYKYTIQAMIQATYAEIQQQTSLTSHTEPRSFNFAAAQRLNADIKTDASIDIGRLKYRSGLLSNPNTDFLGKELRQCLDVIHRDIVTVWNLRNSSYLASDEFKAKMIVLIDDLVENPNTPTSNDGLAVTTVAALASAASSPAGIVILHSGSAVLTAKWVFEVYKNTPRDVACIMAYIIDLTILMHRLLAIKISEERVVSTLQDYAKSREIAQVHNDIRTFSNGIPSARLGDKDYTLNEILRLIEKHRIQVPQA